VTNVFENSFFAIVVVSSFDILLDKKSFSRILRMLGLFTGSLISISAIISLSSLL